MSLGTMPRTAGFRALFYGSACGDADGCEKGELTIASGQSAQCSVHSLSRPMASRKPRNRIRPKQARSTTKNRVGRSRRRTLATASAIGCAASWFGRMARPLIVLNVAYPFAPVGPDTAGGAEQIVSALDRALVRAGHRSLVVGCAGSHTEGRLLVTGPLPERVTEEAWRRAQELHRQRIAEAFM